MFYMILKIVIYAILSLLLKDADKTLCQRSTPTQVKVFLWRRGACMYALEPHDHGTPEASCVGTCSARCVDLWSSGVFWRLRPSEG